MGENPHFDKEKALEIFSEGFDIFLNKSRLKAKDVADIVGVGSSAVSNWKTGKAFPEFQALKMLFEMGMSIENVFGSDLGETIVKNSICDYPKIKLEIIEKYLNENKSEIVRDIKASVLSCFVDSPEFKKGFAIAKKDIEKMEKK